MTTTNNTQPLHNYVILQQVDVRFWKCTGGVCFYYAIINQDKSAIHWKLEANQNPIKKQ